MSEEILTPDNSHSQETRPPAATPLNVTPISAGAYSSDTSEDMSAGDVKTKSLLKELATKDNVTIVLAGRSGAGKSTLVKNVFGVDIDTEMSASSLTKNIQSHSVTGNGVSLMLIDTVGLEDTKKKKQLKDLSKHVKGKADLLLYCLPISPGVRFHESNPAIMKALQDAFGKDIWQHCMVVLTFSNLAWNQIKRSNRSREAAITKYKKYVNDYAEKFEEELRKLKVKNPSIKTVYDLKTIPDNLDDLMFVPAGYKHDDPVMPDLPHKYVVPRKATSCISSQLAQSMYVSIQVPDTSLQMSTLEEKEQEADPEQIIDNWPAILVFLIFKKCPPQCSMALLQFWYGRERIGTTLQEHSFAFALGGGVTGGMTGGAVGAVAGSMVGVVGGPIGVPVGAVVGLGIGVLVGTLLAGGGAAGVSKAAGHALDKTVKK